MLCCVCVCAACSKLDTSISCSVFALQLLANSNAKPLLSWRCLKCMEYQKNNVKGWTNIFASNNNFSPWKKFGGCALRAWRALTFPRDVFGFELAHCGAVEKGTVYPRWDIDAHRATHFLLAFMKCNNLEQSSSRCWQNARLDWQIARCHKCTWLHIGCWHTFNERWTSAQRQCNN